MDPRRRALPPVRSVLVSIVDQARYLDLQISSIREFCKQHITICFPVAGAPSSWPPRHGTDTLVPYLELRLGYTEPEVGIPAQRFLREGDLPPEHPSP